MKSIDDVVQLAVDTLAPMPPGGPRHMLVAKDRRWFEPCIVADKLFDPGQQVGAMTPYFTRDDLGWFTPGVVTGPFSPFNVLPGERLSVRPASVEEFAQERVRVVVHLRICEMARAQEIRPLNHGLYLFEWDDRWLPKDIAHFELSDEDFSKVCAAIPIPFQNSSAPSATAEAKLPVEDAPPADAWKSKAREYATELWTQRPTDTNPTKLDLAKKIAKRFGDEGVFGPRGPRSPETIVREALTGWKPW